MATVKVNAIRVSGSRVQDEIRVWNRAQHVMQIGRQLIVYSLLLLLLAGGLSAAEEVVRAEKGDGIYSLLARHGLAGSEAFDEFVRLNKDKLGPGNTLILGRRYRLPDSAQYVTEPLFGPRLERVKILDHALAGAAFYLVSGHGGPDTGAIGHEDGHTLYEDEYAYDTTLRLGRRLLEHGARVTFIIRDESDGIRDAWFLKGGESERCYPNEPIPRHQRARLRQRADAVNRLYQKDSGVRYRRCIVVHVDSRSSDEGIDTFFYHHDGNRDGKRLAESMRDTFRKEYRINQPGRGYEGSIETRDLFMLRETVPTTVFVEIGNIQHDRDKKRILDPNNRQALANWMCDGIVTDFHKDGK